MIKIFIPFLSISVLALAACTPQAVTIPLPDSPSATAEPTQVPATEPPTATVQLPTLNTYTNSAFGLSFQYPAGWFGPEEYTVDQNLRVEVGSDKVYPYGTGLDERTYELKNSYNIVIQYTRNDQNQYWRDIFQSLIQLMDGESLSDARSKITRVGEVNVGRFKGIEYIVTLSETAQTDAIYARQVILFDDQSNLLSVLGNPNNVEVSEGTSWRDAYKQVDEANQDLFHQIVRSITVQ